MVSHVGTIRRHKPKINYVEMVEDELGKELGSQGETSVVTENEFQNLA